MLTWSRHFAVFALVGAVTSVVVSPAAPAFAREATKNSARVPAPEVRQGALSSTLSLAHRLLARALAVLVPDPSPRAASPPAGPAGETRRATADNGAGIDPNGL